MLLFLMYFKRFGQAWIIFILFMYCLYLCSANTSCHLEITELRAAVNLQNQSIVNQVRLEKAAQEKVDLAQKLSLIHDENAQREVDEIQSANVSPDCDGAMGYLLSQGLRH